MVKAIHWLRQLSNKIIGDSPASFFLSFIAALGMVILGVHPMVAIVLVIFMNGIVEAIAPKAGDPVIGGYGATLAAVVGYLKFLMI